MNTSIINNISNKAVELWASDIHLSVWFKPLIRVNWNLIKLEEIDIITEEDMKSIETEMFNNELEILDKHKLDIDFSFKTDNNIHYRVNSYYKLWKRAFAMRLIEQRAKTMEELNMPKSLNKLLNMKQWLFLFTGPTWSWKSTSLVSVLEEINKTRQEHIMTIEDPIEFFFENKWCFFSQREVWRDTESFIKAIRSSMREDPDIVVIWEMRDRETVDAALSLSETWHLVLSTMHTSWSVQTITRIVQFFPPNIQFQIQKRLADNLAWVLSQRLLDRIDTEWRIAIHELMYLTPGIQSLIRRWDFVQIPNAISMSRSIWMLDFDKSAEILIEKWIISKESFLPFKRQD